MPWGQTTVFCLEVSLVDDPAYFGRAVAETPADDVGVSAAIFGACAGLRHMPRRPSQPQPPTPHLSSPETSKTCCTTPATKLYIMAHAVALSEQRRTWKMRTPEHWPGGAGARRAGGLIATSLSLGRLPRAGSDSSSRTGSAAVTSACCTCVPMPVPGSLLADVCTKFSACCRPRCPAASPTHSATATPSTATRRAFIGPVAQPSRRVSGHPGKRASGPASPARDRDEARIAHRGGFSGGSHGLGTGFPRPQVPATAKPWAPPVAAAALNWLPLPGAAPGPGAARDASAGHRGAPGPAGARPTPPPAAARCRAHVPRRGQAVAAGSQDRRRAGGWAAEWGQKFRGAGGSSRGRRDVRTGD